MMVIRPVELSLFARDKDGMIEVTMPELTQILYPGELDGSVVVYCLTDTDSESVEFPFWLFEAGTELPDLPPYLHALGHVALRTSTWHVFCPAEITVGVEL